VRQGGLTHRKAAACFRVGAVSGRRWMALAAGGAAPCMIYPAGNAAPISLKFPCQCGMEGIPIRRGR
jgi:hypothetical protein